MEWLVPDASSRIVEVGAGTGKFTAVLVAAGLDVVATEPDPGMREALSASLPSVEVRSGTAESIPLRDDSVDVVLGAQCWHWVDQARATLEASRVLVPGGSLGLVWNDRDVSDPWVASMSAVLSEFGQGRDADAGPVQHPQFGPFARIKVRWEHETTVDGVVDMVASRSYAIALAPDRRAELLERIRNHAQARADEYSRLAVPYVTRAYRAE